MAGQYRLAALDMDGTLLDSAHEITPRARDALRRAAERGKLIALCTGRCLSELRAHLSTVPDVPYVIGENGACLYDVRGDRILCQIDLPEATADRILEASRGFDVCRQVFLANQSFIEVADDGKAGRFHIRDFMSVFRLGSRLVADVEACRRETGAPVEKINLYFASAEERLRYRPCLDGMEVGIADSIGIGYEISPPEATKGAGLRALCDILGQSLSETMAVGDGGNDLDMMSTAGFSVAMGNAIDPVRALADAVTDDCDHDGAAKALEAWFLEE